MVSLLRKLVVFHLPLLLLGCLSVPAAFDYGETKEFDGTWSGRLMLSIGEPSCTRRTPITVSVVGGAISGDTKYKSFSARFLGFVADDGVITNGRVEVNNNFYDYGIEGKFEGENAKGTWQNKSCAGKWELRRVRRSVS